ncbi:MAG: Rpp14/Pop5 family protein [archaeon]
MTKFRVKPTQKENWRYLAFELITNAKFKETDVVKAMVSSILRFHGELGASYTNVWMIEFNEGKQNGIMRCSHTAVQEVVAAVTLITKIDDKDAGFNILGVSGTIKKCREKFLIKPK